MALVHNHEARVWFLYRADGRCDANGGRCYWPNLTTVDHCEGATVVPDCLSCPIYWASEMMCLGWASNYAVAAPQWVRDAICAAGNAKDETGESWGRDAALRVLLDAIEANRQQDPEAAHDFRELVLWLYANRREYDVVRLGVAIHNHLKAVEFFTRTAGQAPR